MCLAIPMLVTEVVAQNDPTTFFHTAIVDADGLKQKVRLDLLSQDVKVGDYLIIHAGFAINVLDEHEAHITLELLREMGERIGS